MGGGCAAARGLYCLFVSCIHAYIIFLSIWLGAPGGTGEARGSKVGACLWWAMLWAAQVPAPAHLKEQKFSKWNGAVHPAPKVENLLQSTHPKCGTKSVLNSVEKQNENGKGISMVWNKVFFLLWVLLARLKPGWINFLECFLLILPPVHSITVCRLPYLLTCLQCIIHHYVMYPWLNAEYQIHPAQQWISVKCADLIMQVQYAMRQKRQLCKVCTPQIIPRNAWYSWVEYYHIPCIDFQPRAQENKAKVLYLSDPVDLILDPYWLLSAWMCSPYRIYFKTKLNLYKQLWDRWRRVCFADMEQSLHISELPLELCHVYVKRPGEELLRKCAAMPTHAQGRYCS